MHTLRILFSPTVPYQPDSQWRAPFRDQTHVNSLCDVDQWTGIIPSATFCASGFCCYLSSTATKTLILPADQAPPVLHCNLKHAFRYPRSQLLHVYHSLATQNCLTLHLWTWAHKIIHPYLHIHRLTFSVPFSAIPVSLLTFCTSSAWWPKIGCEIDEKRNRFIGQCFIAASANECRRSSPLTAGISRCGWMCPNIQTSVSCLGVILVGNLTHGWGKRSHKDFVSDIVRFLLRQWLYCSFTCIVMFS